MDADHKGRQYRECPGTDCGRIIMLNDQGLFLEHRPMKGLGWYQCEMSGKAPPKEDWYDQEVDQLIDSMEAPIFSNDRKLILASLHRAQQKGWRDRSLLSESTKYLIVGGINMLTEKEIDELVAGFHAEYAGGASEVRASGFRKGVYAALKALKAKEGAASVGGEVKSGGGLQVGKEGT